jgi:uncharacterized membrane protein
MDRQDLCIDVETGPTRSANGLANHEIRSVSILRIWEWIVDGLSMARAQPLIWLAAILGSADVATALESVAPYRLFATLLLAVVAGATVLTPAGRRNAYQWSTGETRRAMGRHCEALVIVVLGCAAMIRVGQLLSFALLNVKLTTSMMPSGAHSFSIIFGEPNDRVSALEPVLHAIVFAIAIAAVWFAPALIVLRKFSPLDAMITSLRAVFHNGPVALIYAGVLAADAMLAQVVPMLVRGLVLTPLIGALILLSMHGSYRDILSIDTAKDD